MLIDVDPSREVMIEGGRFFERGLRLQSLGGMGLWRGMMGEWFLTRTSVD